MRWTRSGILLGLTSFACIGCASVNLGTVRTAWIADSGASRHGAEFDISFNSSMRLGRGSYWEPGGGPGFGLELGCSLMGRKPETLLHVGPSLGFGYATGNWFFWTGPAARVRTSFQRTAIGINGDLKVVRQVHRSFSIGVGASAGYSWGYGPLPNPVAGGHVIAGLVLGWAWQDHGLSFF